MEENGYEQDLDFFTHLGLFVCFIILQGLSAELKMFN